MKIFLANNLKVLRKEKRISQEELARSLGVSRNKISSYEGKGIEPKLSLLLKLSAFFEVSVDDLVTSPLSIENIEHKRNAFRSLLETQKQSDTSVSVSRARIDKELVHQFITNNERSYKMLDGFRSFYRLKSRKQKENHEVNNLMLILDHVLDVNKTFVHNLKNQLM